jgi:hypothetical protein
MICRLIAVVIAMICLMFSCPGTVQAAESPLAEHLAQPQAQDPRFRLVILRNVVPRLNPAKDPNIQATIQIFAEALSPRALPADEQKRPDEWDYTSFIGTATKYLLSAPVPDDKQHLIAFITSSFRFIDRLPDKDLKNLLALSQRNEETSPIIDVAAKDYLAKTTFTRMDDCLRIAQLATIEQLRPAIWESLRSALMSPDVQNSIRMLSLLDLRPEEQHDLDLLALQTMLNTLDQAEPAPLLVKHRIEKPRLGTHLAANDQTRALITAVAQGKGVYPAQIRALSLLVALGLDDSNFTGLQATMLKTALTWRKEQSTGGDYTTVFLALNDLLLICCLPEDLHEDPLLLTMLDDHFQQPRGVALMKMQEIPLMIRLQERPFYPYLRRRVAPKNTKEDPSLRRYVSESGYWYLRELSDDSLVQSTPLEPHVDEQVRKVNKDPLLVLESFPNLRDSDVVLRDGLKAGRHSLVAAKVFRCLPYFQKAYGRNFIKEILTDATSTGNFNATLAATEVFLLAGDQHLAQQMARRLEPLRPELPQFNEWSWMTYLQLSLIFKHLGMTDTWVDHTLRQKEVEAPQLVSACRSFSEQILAVNQMRWDERHLQTCFNQSSGAGIFAIIGKWQVILKKRIIPTGLGTVRVINGYSLSDPKQKARDAFGSFLGCRDFEASALP